MTAIDGLKKEIEECVVILHVKNIEDWINENIDENWIYDKKRITTYCMGLFDAIQIIDKHLKGKVLVDEKDLLTEDELNVIKNLHDTNCQVLNIECKGMDIHETWKKLKALTWKGKG